VKRNWMQTVVLVGPTLTMASIFWELARTNSSYTYLVEPWSIRGTETVHGLVFFAIGLALLVAGALVVWPGSQRPTTSMGIVALMVLEATTIAALFGPGAIDASINLVWGIVLAVALGIVTWRLVRLAIGERVEISKLVSSGGRLIAMGIWFGILQATLIGRSLSVPLAVAVFLVFALIGFLATTGEPRGLAANRMLIVSSAIGWLTVTLSAGALRSTLLRLQTEAEGISAAYRDVQVAPGWWLAGFGMVLLFVGSVGVWAARRDTMLAAMRARHQREAADKSRREIEEAMERFRSQQQAAAD